MRPSQRVAIAMLCNLEMAPLTVRMASEIAGIVLGETKAGK